MCQMISILVDREARVYAVDGVHSHSEIATRCGVDEDKCLKYEFVLATRTLKQDFDMDCAPFEAKQSHDAAAQHFFDAAAGDAERLIAYVKRGSWMSNYLLPLLTAPARAAYEAAAAPALAACDAATAPARAAYEAATAPAWAACEAATAPAWAAYEAATAQARAAYEAATAQAWAAYEAARAQAWAAYEAARAQAWAAVFAVPENRIAVWR